MSDATKEINGNRPEAAIEKPQGPPKFTHFSKAQKTFKPPLIANENAFLGDVISNDKIDPEKPLSCGFYRLEKGTPLVYTYTYHEMKIIVEGEFIIEDESGQKVTAGPGDVFYFPKGAKITFSTNDYGLAFYVSASFMKGLALRECER
ncbi:MAG: hypothetical protein M1827_001045 [Pycnora praestabilis]|nr:MAG: hypothetical protein M1827_001045 [Pycnora praestabilis]